LEGADWEGAILERVELHRTEVYPPKDIQAKCHLVWKIKNGEMNEPGDRDLTGLQRRDLSNTKLQGVDLSGAKLCGFDLRNTDLSGANLQGADLSGADLRRATLTGANLCGAKLRSANLTLVSLSGVIFDEQTELDQKWKDVCNISNLKILDRNCEGLDLEQANLSGVYLVGVSLQNTKLRGADLSRANLEEANLQGADLRGANLTLARLYGSKIDWSTKIDVKWRLVWEIVNRGAYGRNLRGVDLQGAFLQEVDFSTANLCGTLLRFADLTGANISDASYNEETTWPTDFNPEAAGGIATS